VRLLKDQGRAALPPAPHSILAVFVAALVLVVVSTGSATGASGAAGGAMAVRPAQTVAILLGSQMAMSAPARRSKALQRVDGRRPITKVRTVLPVLGQRPGADGAGWLRVLLPGRPNGHTGWIRRGASDTARENWHIAVDTSKRRVTVYKKGRVVRVYKAIVGKAATPTPRGRFFVEETVKLGPRDAGAPFALALSAHSDVLQEFAGGPGQVAFHGLSNVGGVLGTAVSHGCIRLSNDAMRWLVVRIGPGVPVTIT
jgi:lipoprotein-anchoring transpeptidase ErfK/SrfK